MSNKRSLYQCYHAKVKADRIVCDRGHSISTREIGDGSVGIVRLARGVPLTYTSCQDCADYLEMGPPVAKEDRGWRKRG